MNVFQSKGHDPQHMNWSPVPGAVPPNWIDGVDPALRVAPKTELSTFAMLSETPVAGPVFALV